MTDLAPDPVALARELRRRERRRQRHRRHHQSDEDESDDEESSDFPVWKTLAVVAIIIGCFCVLYPKMFHPMLLLVLGLNKKPEPEPSHGASHHGPHHQAGRPPPPSNDPHLHAGPHPAMRMAGAGGVGGAAAATASKGKGMWHTLLPFYTVGVIIFLLYTLSKIMWKSPKKKSKAKRYRGGRVQGNETSQSSDSSTEEEDPGRKEEAESEGGDGDDVLAARRGGQLSTREMKGLQKRLNQTETAMQKILGQLETLSVGADPATAAQVKEMTMETLNNLAKVEATANSLEETETSNARRRRGKKDAKPGKETKYLEDLERALSDFKRFTEDYVQEHAEAAIKRELDQMTEEKAARRENEVNSLIEDDEPGEVVEEVGREETVDADEEDDASGEDKAEDEDDASSEGEEDGTGAIPLRPGSGGLVEEENGDAGDEATSSEEEEAEPGTSGEPDVLDRGFDVCEADLTGELEMGEPVGEIVDVTPEEDEPRRSNGALRRRQRRT